MDTFAYLPSQRILARQGVADRAASVRNKFIRRWAVWIFLFTGLALFCVWGRVQVIKAGYEITNLKMKADEMAKQAGSIELEIAKLKSPRRLEQVATERLGLQSPKGQQIVLIKP